MTNVTSFDASRIMREISKVAPFALLTCALLSFIAVGIFSVDYYQELFLKRFTESARFMAIMVAVIQEAVRFGLLIASIRDFADRKPLNGWLGLIGSIALVIHDVSIAKSLALIWDPLNPVPYSSILVFLILIGLLLEVRLILTVGKELPAERTLPAERSYQPNGVHA